jgi:hypothetical protein
MPLGALVTVPEPSPFLRTVSVSTLGVVVNCATTVWLTLITVTQAPVPLHPPPLQPTKVDPLAAAALSVTDEPLRKPALQAGPQSMPGGELVTVPLPVPVFETVRVAVLWGGLNIAVLL